MLSGARLRARRFPKGRRRSCFTKQIKPLADAIGLSRRVCRNACRAIHVADDFKAGEVGERYAQALFDLALETGALDRVRKDLDEAGAMIAESADLRRLLTSPVFSAEDKASGLAAVGAAAKFAPVTMKFFGLLARNRRGGALPSVIGAFARLHDRRRGVVAAEVVSALPLDAKQVDGIRKALRQALGKDPEIATRVDPSILGGLKVRVGSRLFDASLKSKLDSLKFALKRA
jgi:F-type H+-transporting ATPase subunit delta